MENYREKLKIQNITLFISACILAVFAIISILAEAGIIPFFVPTGGDSHWQSNWRGFICGAATGILGLVIFGLVRNLRALKDEKKLKQLYIKENDERTCKIWKEARNSGMVTFLLFGIVATIVAGYFSISVSLTILACLCFNSAICLYFVLYYSKKF